MAAEVEGVEGRSRPSQDEDGGRWRTRHPQITLTTFCVPTDLASFLGNTEQ